jgi:fructokinase
MDRVLVVGEALVDIVEPANGGRAEHPGGSPANVALGLARLGHECDLLTRIGDDERGGAIWDRLHASGVRLVPGSVTPEPTSTATAHLDERGVATYDFDLDWRLPTGADPGEYRHLHTGSIAAFLPPGAQAVAELVAAAHGRTTVSYDPNARPRLMGDPAAARVRIEEIVAACDVVKVSDEDLVWLTPGEDPEAVARRWLASGPAVVVVTLGGEGALAISAAGAARATSPVITVADTVGAGDAFMSGLIDALLRAGLLGIDRVEALRAVAPPTLESVLAHAVRVAAITCTRAGAQPPTRSELQAWTG